MIEKKTIKDLQFLKEKLYNGIFKEKSNCIDKAIQALEEIQQYRAIGTVEGYEKAIQATTEYYLLMKEYKSKVQDFEAIGTVEEFKTLKEKSELKKAKWEFDEFTAQFGNPYRCSNCNEEFGDTYNYCPNCGCDMYADCLAMKGE